MNLITATQQAKLKNPNIGTQVKQGKFQVVNVTFNDKGKSTVTPLTDYMPLNNTVKYLISVS